MVEAILDLSLETVPGIAARTKERVATIVDSPYHPSSEAMFRITDRGVDDLENPRKRKSRRFQ